jgi:hypothetical protein
MSRAYLEHLLSENSAYYADEATVGAYYYKPAPVPVTAGEDADEEDLDDE